jgi:CheY-like chemotaxis protein
MKKSLRMLVVEDSEEDTLLLTRELARADFDPVVERVVNAKAMSSALNKHPWDIVVCDHSMPGFGSLDALKLLQEKKP